MIPSSVYDVDLHNVSCGRNPLNHNTKTNTSFNSAAMTPACGGNVRSY